MEYWLWKDVSEEHEPEHLIYTVVTEAEFRAVFGPNFGIHPILAELDGWRVVKLMDVGPDGAASCDQFFEDEDRDPVAGLPVSQYWPGAPERSGVAPGTGLPDSITERCDLGETNQEGRSGWSWGGGSYYTPWPDENTPVAETGPHAYWPTGALAAEVLHGVGMLRGTNHRHYNAVWRFIKGSQGPVDPPVDPTDPTLEQIDTKLTQCIALQEQILHILRLPPP